MAGSARLKKGFLLPEQIEHDLICVTLKIPNAPEYIAAFRGQLKGLTEWWNWERRVDKGNIEAANYWRQIIDEHLIIQDCDELELFGGDMAQFGVCWKLEECGYVLYYSLNGNCTETKVLDCDGNEVCFPQTLTPPNPIDEPVDTPDLGGWLSNCQLVNGVIMDLISYRLYNFVDQILCNAIFTNGSANAGRNALTAWLIDRAMMKSVYFDAFYALMTKYADAGCAFRDYMDDESLLADYMRCETLLCMNGEISRSVMSCVGEAITAFPYANATALQHAAFAAFFKDFMNIYPIEVLRQFALNLNPGAVSNDCTACDVTEPTGCGYAFRWIWKYAAIEENYGWITLPDGAANQWNAGDVDFTSRIITAMSRYYGVGWRVNCDQHAPPFYAGAIEKSFDEPFQLCEFEAVGFGSTGKSNTRLCTAWARVAGSATWVNLGYKKIPIYTTGIIDIRWFGDLVVDKLLVVGATGGGYWQVESVSVNWSME